MTVSQLRSWRPRRPSAALKRRLFGFDAEALNARWLWSCLAPTMACALLALMAFNHDNVLRQTVPMAALLTNQNAAAYAIGDGQAPQNHVALVTFDLTNRSAFESDGGWLHADLLPTRRTP